MIDLVRVFERIAFGAGLPFQQSSLKRKFNILHTAVQVYLLPTDDGTILPVLEWSSLASSHLILYCIFNCWR